MNQLKGDVKREIFGEILRRKIFFLCFDILDNANAVSLESISVKGLKLLSADREQ